MMAESEVLLFTCKIFTSICVSLAMLLPILGINSDL
jgi:hypothetical protein